MNVFANLMKFHQGLFKILRKQNVTDTLSFVRSFVRSFGQRETVYPPTNTVCGGGYNKKIMYTPVNPSFTI